ncbi:hypothetical protein ACF0H5_007136 [Mactra antiquata]
MGQSDSQPSKHLGKRVSNKPMVVASQTVQSQEARNVSNRTTGSLEAEQKKLLKKNGKKAWKKTRFVEVSKGLKLMHSYMIW